MCGTVVGKIEAFETHDSAKGETDRDVGGTRVRVVACGGGSPGVSMRACWEVVDDVGQFEEQKAKMPGPCATAQRSLPV